LHSYSITSQPVNHQPTNPPTHYFTTPEQPLTTTTMSNVPSTVPEQYRPGYIPDTVKNMVSWLIESSQKST
jgi:hypothetical protein